MAVGLKSECRKCDESGTDRQEFGGLKSRGEGSATKKGYGVRLTGLSETESSTATTYDLPVVKKTSTGPRVRLVKQRQTSNTEDRLAIFRAEGSRDMRTSRRVLALTVAIQYEGTDIAACQP